MFDPSSSDTNSLRQFVDASLAEMVSNSTQLGDRNLIAGYASQAITAAQTQLQAIATNPDLLSKLEIPFGTNFDRDTANSLFQGFANADFGALPDVQILSADILGANGGFGNSTVYLSDRFLTENAGNLDAITGVVLEEYGHAIDSLINIADSVGDEGEIFSAIGQGKNLDATQLQVLKAEDDSAKISIDGKEVLIEEATTSILWRNFNSGQTLIWKINPTTMTRESNINVVTDSIPDSSGWKVAGNLVLISSTSTPSTSNSSKSFQLPYPDGSSYRVNEGNANNANHTDPYNKFAWDFNMSSGSPVVATRAGTVISLYEAPIQG